MAELACLTDPWWTVYPQRGHLWTTDWSQVRKVANKYIVGVKNFCLFSVFWCRTLCRNLFYLDSGNPD